MQFKDYYETLGVEASAGDAEIKTAYRRLARKYHPDVSKEKGAEERFKAVNEAYEVLRDKDKRAEYDQLRAQGYRPGEEFRPPPGFGQSRNQPCGVAPRKYGVSEPVCLVSISWAMGPRWMMRALRQWGGNPRRSMGPAQCGSFCVRRPPVYSLMNMVVVSASWTMIWSSSAYSSRDGIS